MPRQAPSILINEPVEPPAPPETEKDWADLIADKYLANWDKVPEPIRKEDVGVAFASLLRLGKTVGIDEMMPWQYFLTRMIPSDKVGTEGFIEAKNIFDYVVRQQEENQRISETFTKRYLSEQAYSQELTKILTETIGCMKQLKDASKKLCNFNEKIISGKYDNWGTRLSELVLAVSDPLQKAEKLVKQFDDSLQTANTTKG